MWKNELAGGIIAKSILLRCDLLVTRKTVESDVKPGFKYLRFMSNGASDDLSRNPPLTAQWRKSVYDKLDRLPSISVNVILWDSSRVGAAVMDRSNSWNTCRFGSNLIRKSLALVKVQLRSKKGLSL